MIKSQSFKARIIFRGSIRVFSSSHSSFNASRSASSSINDDEISHFDELAATWWDPNGSSGLLHKMNPARLSFIKDHIDPLPSSSWLSGRRVLDVGCGGGILTESLRRLGGQVTGVDASEQGIKVAKEHAFRSNLVGIDYKHCSVDDLLPEEKDSFDVICAMEILEHVIRPASFLKTILSLLSPDGILFISTIEKSVFAKLLTITMAEDILRLVPKGTHTYDKFIPKDAMRKWSSDLGADVVDTRGIIYEPWRGKWTVLKPGQEWGEQCNYIMAIKKKQAHQQ